MALEITIVEQELGSVIEIEKHIHVWKMPSVIGESYGKIQHYLEANGAEIVEMPYVRYLDVEWGPQMKKGFWANLISLLFQKWHMKIGMRSSKHLPSDGDLQSDTLQKRRYIKLLHVGPYQKVSQSYKRIYQYAQDSGLEIANESCEIYLNSPKEAKPSALKTIIMVPIVEDFV